MYNDHHAMTLANRQPPLTEPQCIKYLYLSGVAVEISAHTVAFTGWVDMPDLGPETDERRIVVRFAMPIDAARRLRNELALLGREK
jgi:hypothetical protein